MLDLLHKWAQTPFDYGRADCCQFVAECVSELRGYNPMRCFSYDDEKSANKIIEQYGSLREAVTAVLGDPIDDPVDGDVALMEINGRQLAAIVYRDRCIFRTESGNIADVPASHAVCYWKT